MAAASPGAGRPSDVGSRESALPFRLETLNKASHGTPRRAPTILDAPGGRAHIGGVDLGAIAARYGTPAYVFDVAHLEARMQEIGAALDGVGTPVYATKAFLCTALAEMLADSDWWADVVSLGEAENVRRGEFPQTASCCMEFEDGTQSSTWPSRVMWRSP